MKSLLRSRLVIAAWLGGGLALSMAANVYSQRGNPSSPEMNVRFDSPQALDADGVVRMGLERNGELAAIRAERDAARARMRQAGTLPNPSLLMQQGGTRGGMDSSFMIESMIPLEIQGVRGARIRVAESELGLKDASLVLRGRDLAVELRNAFSRLVVAQRRLRILGDALSASEEIVGLVRASVQVGKAAPLEESVSMLELNRLKTRIEYAQSELSSAVFSLKALMGLKPEELLEVKTNISVEPELMRNDSMGVSSGLVSRPELVGARALHRFVASRISLARAEGRPELEFSARYESGRTGFHGSVIVDGSLAPIEKEMRMFTFGIRLSLPVFNRNQGELAALRNEEEAAKSRIAYGELVVRNEIAKSLAGFERAFRAAETFEFGVAGMALKNVGLYKEAFAVGGISLSEFLKERRSALETELESVELKREAFDAQTEFLKAVGSSRLFQR